MTRALIIGGDDPAGQRLAAMLREGGAEVVLWTQNRRAAATADPLAQAAHQLAGQLDLLIWIPEASVPDTIASVDADAWTDRVGDALRTPFMLLQGFAAQASKAGEDAEGPRPRALVVALLDRAQSSPAAPSITGRIAQAGLWALLQSAAQSLAPDIRVNAILRDPNVSTPESDADLGAALSYLLAVPAITGQCLSLGVNHGAGAENLTLRNSFSATR